MSSYHDLVQALSWLLLNKLQASIQYTHGVLGDGLGHVAVPGRDDFSYVRPDRFSSRFFEVFNKRVTAPEGTPVIVGELPWQPGLTQVLDVDWETYIEVGWGGSAGGLPLHGRMHEWRDGAPSVDTFNVYRRQMAELKTYPVGSGSTSVYVSAYNFSHLDGVKSYRGPGLDLGPAVPSATGSARMALVYWDPASGTTGVLGVATGTLSVDAEAEWFNWPSAPIGTIPSGWVRLRGGQSTIKESDIWDARPLWQPSLEFGTGTSGIWAGLIPIGDPGGNFTGTTVEAALEELGDSRLLASYTATGTVSSITLNVPETTYRHLTLMVEIRSTQAANIEDVALRFNGDTGRNYDWINHWGSGAGSQNSYFSPTGTYMNLGVANAATARSNTFSPFVIHIYNYRTTDREKSVVSDWHCFGDMAAANSRKGHNGGNWRDTSPITSITILFIVGNVEAGTTAHLYGFT